LGLSRDLTPAGLIATANAAGLGASSSSGMPLPPQVRRDNHVSKVMQQTAGMCGGGGVGGEWCVAYCLGVYLVVGVLQCLGHCAC
jgi:hypothetical protein